MTSPTAQSDKQLSIAILIVSALFFVGMITETEAILTTTLVFLG
ncbi:hypothetical protein [Ruegeria sp. R13_0]